MTNPQASLRKMTEEEFQARLSVPGKGEPGLACHILGYHRPGESCRTLLAYDMRGFLPFERDSVLAYREEAVRRHTPRARIRNAWLSAVASILAGVAVMLGILRLVPREITKAHSLLFGGIFIGALVGGGFVMVWNVLMAISSYPSWRHESMRDYRGAISEDVLDEARILKGRCPAVDFYVQSLCGEHLLLAVHGDERYVIGAWCD